MRQFDTGAVRSKDAEDVAYHLISPIGLEAVARTCAEGAKKYSPYNWEKGMPADDILNHALRHIYKFLAGDRSEPHLPHAAWGILAAIHSLEVWPELNEGRFRAEGCKAPEPDGKRTPLRGFSKPMRDIRLEDFSGTEEMW